MNNAHYAIQIWNRQFAMWAWFKWYADGALRDRVYDGLCDSHSYRKFRKVG